MAQIGHRIVLDVVRELDQTLDQDDLRMEVFVGNGHNFAHGHDLDVVGFEEEDGDADEW